MWGSHILQSHHGLSFHDLIGICTRQSCPSRKEKSPMYLPLLSAFWLPRQSRVDAFDEPLEQPSIPQLATGFLQKFGTTTTTTTTTTTRTRTRTRTNQRPRLPKQTFFLLSEVRLKRIFGPVPVHQLRVWLIAIPTWLR